jgi:hypothetical protein
MRKIFLLLCFIAVMCSCNDNPGNSFNQLPVLKPNDKTGFSNGGWKYDRYKDLESLDAGKSIVIADLKGPGIITQIHTTRHSPEELFSRGIVLIIYFDDAGEPAVQCPLADFFGDGSNGNSMDFTSNLIECAPGSYNAYIPMPFKKSAKVILRNDTKKNAMNYSYVEWEKVPKWKAEYGYFHATYRRMSFQLNMASSQEFFKVKGTGHLIGRQFSISTDDPVYRKGFYFIMEGNNEINIDGQERAIDYLGTEDSFTFSWGFNKVFNGLHAGMTLIDLGDTSYLSIFRFHDHMPIRFNKELEWKIEWGKEFAGFAPFVNKTIDTGEGYVDYATVFYWYLNEPGGYVHDSLPPIEERNLRLIKNRESKSGV